MTPTLSQGQAEPTDARRTLFELARICFDAGIKHGHGAKNDWSSDGKALQIIDRLAAAQLAAVAAPPEVKDLRDAKWLDPECAHAGACQSLRFKAAVAAPEARIEGQSLDHPAASQENPA